MDLYEEVEYGDNYLDFEGHLVKCYQVAAACGVIASRLNSGYERDNVGVGSDMEVVIESALIFVISETEWISPAAVLGPGTTYL